VDNTPLPPRRNPTPPQDLDRHRQRGDWHETDDWDLELQDELGGHGFLDHVYKTWQQVADRILNSRNRLNNASSRFIDADTANKLAHETLKANSIKIQKWLNNANSKGYIELIYTPANQQITGFTLPKGMKNFIAVDKVKIILVRTGNNSYRIKTFYPYHK